MNVLIIGLGSIAKKHIKALLLIDPKITIWALRSTKNSEVIDHVINIYSVKELLFTPNFVIISNPTYKHIDSIKLSLTFKCPIFIEKPISHTLHDALDLFQEINTAGIITYVGCNLRFLSCMQFLHSHILSHPEEKINEVNVYCGSYLPQWRNGGDSYSFYADKGGGVHLDLIHELDYLYWFWGKPDGVRSYKSSNSSLSAASIDYANYLLTYKDFTANVILNYYRIDTKRSCEIVFSDKTWLVNIMENKITEGEIVIYENSMRTKDTYLPQMKYFINCIQNNIQPINSFAEAFEVLQICLHD